MKVRAALAAFALAASGPVPAQDRPEDPAEIINTLLAGLAGFRETTPAELQAEVGEVGGVPFRADVPLDYMGRSEMVRYVQALLDEEYPPGRAEADARTLVGLDLLEPGTDLRGLRARLLEENVAGFYDERPGRKRLYTISDDRRLTPSNQLVLAHELRHALQDQYAELHAALPPSVGDFDDRRLAFLGLLEGDATLVMERFLLRRLTGGEGPPLELKGLTLPPDAVPGAPPVLRDQLVMPYLAGREFADTLVRRGGWEAVRAAWSRPPESTEQLLHPEKFLEREPPRPVAATHVPSGARLVNEGVLGEMLVRTLLGEDAPAAASAGWGGDLYQVFDAEGRTVVVWRSVWDAPPDAHEFQEALRARFRRVRGAARSRRGFEAYAAGAWTFAMGELAGGVILVSSDDPARLEAALNGLDAAEP